MFLVNFLCNLYENHFSANRRLSSESICLVSRLLEARERAGLALYFLDGVRGSRFTSEIRLPKFDLPNGRER